MVNIANFKKSVGLIMNYKRHFEIFSLINWARIFFYTHFICLQNSLFLSSTFIQRVAYILEIAHLGLLFCKFIFYLALDLWMTRILCMSNNFVVWSILVLLLIYTNADILNLLYSLVQEVNFEDGRLTFYFDKIWYLFFFHRKFDYCV